MNTSLNEHATESTVQDIPTHQESASSHTTGAVTLAISDTSTRWEVTAKEKNPETPAISNFQKGLLFVIALVAVGVVIFFHTAFFGSNWLSFAIVLTGLPALAIAAIPLKKLFLGNMSKKQKWVLTPTLLQHTFTALGGREITHTYATENIKVMAFFPDRIVLRLHKAQRGFTTHIMSPPVSFSPALREQLAQAVQQQGVTSVT